MPSLLAAKLTKHLHLSPGRTRAFVSALALAVTVGVSDRAAADPSEATNLNPGVFGEGSMGSLGTSSTGSMTYRIPFRMPPGRGKVSASLGLNYDSSSSDREAGFGWGLSIPSIERLPTSGWPRYADGAGEVLEDRYAYNGERLEWVCNVGAGACDGTPMPTWASGWRYYKTKTRSADFARFFLSPGRRTWKVQFKGGVIHEFGAAETAAYGTGEAFDCATREQDCSTPFDNTNPVFRWRLAREVDNHGNYVVYGWDRRGTRGLAYLTDVWEVPHAALGGLEDYGVHVALDWEPWDGAPAPPSYTKMDRTRPDMRLRRVTIAAKSWAGTGTRDLVAAYHLTYLVPRGTPYAPGAQAPLFGHTFLANVKMEGACGAQEDAQQRFSPGPGLLCPGQPSFDTALHYSEGELSPHQVVGPSQIANPPPLAYPLEWPQAGTVIDANGDGLPDVLEGWEFTKTGPFETCRGQNNLPSKIHVQRDANGNLELKCLIDGGGTELPAGNPLPAHKVLLNRGAAGGGLGAAQMEFRCVDGESVAQVHSPAPGVRVPNTFLNGNGRTLHGAWGEGIVAWAAPTMPEGTDPAFAALMLEPAATTSGCPMGAGASPGGYRWVEAPASWYRQPPYAPDVPGAVPPPKTYSDIDGDGFVDLLTTRGEPAWAGLERMDVAFTRRYWQGEDHGAVAVGTPGNVLMPFAHSMGETTVVLRGAGASFNTDVNGDGVPDFVHAVGASISIFPGDGRGGFSCDDREACLPHDAGAPAWFGRFYAPVVSHPIGATGWLAGVYLHDVNGDGLADIIAVERTMPIVDPPSPTYVRVWLNRDGHDFQCPFVGETDPCRLGTFYDDVGQRNELPYGLTFADMNGDGVDDVVMRAPRGVYYLSAYGSYPQPQPLERAPRPGLLVKVDDHRVSTQVQYKTVQELDLEAEANAAGYDFPRPWTTHSPRVDTVVTQVTRRDRGLPAYGGTPPAPFAFNRATVYAYQDPMFDPWTRRLLGFRKVRSKLASEAAVTETTFWFGNCHHTFDGTSGGPRDCPETSEGDDARPQPYRAGLPVRVDRFIPSPPGEPATWLSTVALRYDSWNAVSQVDTYLFDTGAPVILDSGDAVYGVDNLPLVERVPTQAGSAHIVSGVTRDPHGNASEVVELGNVTAGDAHRQTSTSATECDADWLCVPTGGVDRDQRVFEVSTQGTVLKRHTVHRYDALGDLTHVLAYSSPTAPLPRSPLGVGEPATATAGGLVTIAQFGYDAWGNQTFARTFDNPGSCVYTEFDAAFRQFPEVTATFNHDCGGAQLDSSSIFDRRFGRPKMEIAWDGTVHAADYDFLGRLTTTFAPAPDGGAPAATTEVAQFTYEDRVDHVNYAKVRTVTSNDQFHHRYVLFNGLREPAVLFDEADPAAGDGGTWVQASLAERNAFGQVIRTYRPEFTATSPESVSAAGAPIAPTTAAITMHHDAFGRATGVDHGPSFSPTPVSRTTHHATSVDVQDAEELAQGAGHKTTVHYDGYGRPVKTERRTATHDVDILVSYEVTGEPRSITQRDAGTQATVTRTVEHDERGRLTTNFEPNSGVWHYRYDDGGRLVATSDARGCGVNYHYDGFGRVLVEDYSPCEASQQAYSAPDLYSGDGAEVFYRYDTYEPDQVLGPDEDPDYALGRLVSIKDRGGHTRMHYDSRGRVVRVSRRAAKPGVPSDVIDDRYTPHWYERATTYDRANRVTQRTTGADVPELMGAAGTSFEAFGYSRRGLQIATATSYDNAAPLVHDQRYNAAGQPEHWQYGDASATQGEATYDPIRGWLTSYLLFRGAGPWATQQLGGSYTPPDAETTPVDLARVSLITRDAVGNPTNIPDTAQGWIRAGSKPASRAMEYDGFYRVTRVTTSTGGDEDVSPFHPEVSAGSSKPVPSRRSGPGTRPVEQTYTYDWLGNTTETTDDVSLRFDRSLGTITNDAARPNQLKDADGVHADYDAAGNLVSLTVERPTCGGTGTTLCTHRFVYDWDEAGQLVRARRWDYPMGAIPAAEPTHPDVPTQTPAWDLSYAYSAGARIRKSATDAQGITRHSLEVFDSLRLDDAAWEIDDYQRDRLTETALVGGIARVAYDANAELPTPTGSLLHVYIAMGDHLGSTTAIVDKDTGEVVERAAYHPYGQIETDFRPDRWGNHRESIKFTGKEEDVEVGLTYFGARYLNARLGRWMSPDPLSVHAAAADLNVYAYVGGRVASHVDPWGLDAMPRLDAEPIPSAPPEGPPDATYTHDNGTTVSMWCGGCNGGESFGAPAGAPMEAFTLGMPETLANQVSHGAAAGAGRTAGRETPASGSRARIPARPYASPGAAAFAALARYNGYSIDNEVELGGLIYEATEIIDGAPVKRYYHTPAVDTFKNTPETSHPIEARPLIPRGGKVVGMFHTHAKHVPGRHAALRPNQTNGQGWIFGPWSPQDHSALQTMVDRGIMPSDGISALATSSGHFSIINTGTPLGGEQYFFSSNLYVNWSGISSQWSGPWYLNQAGKLLPPR